MSTRTKCSTIKYFDQLRFWDVLSTDYLGSNCPFFSLKYMHVNPSGLEQKI